MIGDITPIVPGARGSCVRALYDLDGICVSDARLRVALWDTCDGVPGVWCLCPGSEGIYGKPQCAA